MNLLRRLAGAGWRRRVDPEIVATVEKSGLFRPKWYRERHPEARRHPGGALAHFVEVGLAAGLDPGPDFSTDSYRRRCPDLPVGEPPFLHAMRARGPLTDYRWAPDDLRAFRRAIAASELFDPGWYAARNPDVGANKIDPLDHYLSFGASENRAPGPGFDPLAYAEDHPDHDELFPTPVEHFIRYGRPRGFPGLGQPIYARWLALHDEVTSADEAAIAADIAARPLPRVQVVRLDPGFRRGEREGGDHLGKTDFAWEGAAHPGESRGPAAAIVIMAGGGADLRPHAAYAFCRAIEASGADAAYCDHDVLTEAGRADPVFTPAMSPEYLRRDAYAGPVAAFRNGPAFQAALAALPDTESDASETIARLLLAMDPGRVVRLPWILYHLPTPPDRPPPRPDPAPQVEDWPTVSLVIPTRDKAELLRACLESLERESSYPNGLVETVVVDNGSAEADAVAYLDALRSRPRTRVVASPGPFNFSRLINDGVAASAGEIVVLLNNDTTVFDRDWLQRLVAFARRPEIGAVGGKLLFPDGTIQHGGVVLGWNGVGGHRLVGLRHDNPALRDVTREMTALTGACLAIRRELFDRLSGLDPVLEVAFNDVQLCAGAVEHGFRNIYVAEPLLIHHESQSRGFDLTPAQVARNIREANYVAMRHADLFRDDPAYNPNLSLAREMDKPAFPPRCIRPWRHLGRGRNRVLMLSTVHSGGYGVPAVLGLQTQALLARGFDVTVGGPIRSDDRDYPGCTRVSLKTARQAADLAASEAFDAVVAHTPPFFSVARMLGAAIPVYAVDYGEPDPAFFPDRLRREGEIAEKRLSAPFARRVIAISQAIRDQQFRADAEVIRIGNSHLATWDESWARRRAGIRQRLGFDDRFVVLKVCRFESFERGYKGVDRFVSVAQEFGPLHPAHKERCLFVLAGRGAPEDVAAMECEGLRVFANVDDAAMAELYAAADAYMSFSRWEGYNLGIGQALAMGLPVVASDIPAHREFPIEVTDSPLRAGEMLADLMDGAQPRDRAPWIESWERPLARFCDLLEADLAQPPDPWRLGRNPT